MKIVKYIIPLHLLIVVTLLAGTGMVSAAGAYKRRSNNTNSVRVEIVPVQLGHGRQAKFEVRMNTHSVELNHDMLAVSILKDDQGHEYQPLTWDGSPPGSHHRSGILVFPAIEKAGKSVTLHIKNIANVPERVFEWKVKQ